MTAYLQLNNLTKSYSGASFALKDFSLDVEEGEFIVIVGPSGCGKSTLLRLIAGLENLSEGEISIHGSRIDTLPPGKRNLALMLQSYTLFPHLSIFDNMAFGLKLKKLSKEIIQKKIEAAADTLGIKDLLLRFPHTLSGGQRQRAALGRAMVRDPQVFLLDEPLSNLDAQLRTQMRMEISQLQKKLGKTMLYVTHDQTEAMTMGDRIVVLNRGVTQQIGTPMDVYQQPENLFTAEFIGSPGMNTFTTPLSAEISKRIAVSQDQHKQVTVGFRAEHTCIKKGKTPTAEHFDGMKIQMEVSSIENLGSRVWIHGKYNNSNLTIPSSGTQAIPGQFITLLLAWKDLHFFHPLTGKAL